MSGAKLTLSAIFCAAGLASSAQEAPVVLMPFREAVVASALDSELKQYHYKIGEGFTNGAVVAELDDARYRIAFLRAREHRDFTAKSAKEQRELRAKDFASEMDFRKADYESKVAAADFDEAEINLRRCRFTAPFNGKIAELMTQCYETVKPGQPLFRIIEDDRLLAVANLPLGSVKVGEKVSVVPDAASAVSGTVYEVAPQADNRTGTVRVRVMVDNASGALTAGMTGTLKWREEPAKPAAAEPAAPDLSERKFDFLSAGDRYLSVQDAFSDRPCEPGTPAPAIEFAGLYFEDGIIGYVLKRNASVVSIHSVKRVGEFTAGLYSTNGVRLAYVEPKQIALPAAQGTVTNVAFFPPAQYLEALAKKTPLKLVLNVESDIRAMDVNVGGGKNGGK